jgi:hypothetical protein
MFINDFKNGANKFKQFWLLLEYCRFSQLTPYVPLSNRFIIVNPRLTMFKRGRDFERGLRPLSPELPSPAVNICGFLSVILAGEGIKG